MIMEGYKDWTSEMKAGYLLRMLSNERVPEDQLELLQGWLCSNDNAEEKEKQLNLVFDQLFQKYSTPSERTYELLAMVHQKFGLPALERPVKKKVNFRKRIAFKIAAVIIPVLFLAGGALMFLKYNAGEPGTGVPETYLTVMAAAGQPNEVILPDGSKVRLANDTEMTYAEDFTAHRAVKLTGEAFFSVRSDRENPFTVETDKVSVTVLGTEFNMKAYPNDAQTVVSLASGSVEVKGESGNVRLAPMEEFRYDNRTGLFEVAAFEPEKVDRWKTGTKELKDMSLREALRTVSDFYDKHLVVVGKLPEDQQINTMLREAASIESVLQGMRFVSDDRFDYEIKDDTLFISAR